MMDLIAPPEPYSAIIFDCDGTLADTMPNHYIAWISALRSFGADLDEGQFYSMGGMPTDAIVRRLNEEYGYGLDVEETHLTKEKAYVESLHSVVEIKAVADIARANYGKVPMAVASGGTRNVVEATLRTLGMLTLFDAIVTANDVEHGKPAPDIFLLAAEKLGVPSSGCVVYEDGDVGLEAARRAGIRCVDVRQLWNGKPSPSAR